MRDRARCRLAVRGLVQGVGFRPFVHRIAGARGLSGVVRNTAGGVAIEAEGERDAVLSFVAALRAEAPPLSRVDAVSEEWVEPRGEAGFAIGESAGGGAAATAVPPDVASCPACLRELADPANRRFRYPFLNCTDCGPRYTIAAGVPWDRERTTMRSFQMCPECRAEYGDPRSRRFHAEPNACPRCGPRAWIEDAGGRREEGDPFAAAARRLAAGEIVAVKGIGGFHLAVDAGDEGAVARLRERKQRDRKPFAVLARDPAAAAAFCRFTAQEERLLLSPARPIVLLRLREPSPLAPSVAPGLSVAGVMLPYAPLHHLLLEACSPAVLVMTSANPRDEPIVREDAEARERLAGIADAFLLHDREILARCDDSVVMECRGPRMVRRSRGFVPLPVALPVSGPPVLAAGGDLKNAPCLTRGDEAFPGPHVGDLGSLLAGEHFLEVAGHMADLLGVRPRVVVHDIHPDAHSARLARALAEGPFRGSRLLGVQHHHAHVLSCLAENGVSGPALGLALDGAGHGTDGVSWGGEILAVDGLRFERLAHLPPLRLPGGDLAPREVWRLAVGAACALGREGAVDRLAARWPSADPAILSAVRRLCLRGVPMPLTTSLGRLFDAAAAILGVRDLSTYEGEAAVALEQAAGGEGIGGGARGPGMDTAPLLSALLDDALGGTPAAVASARFHGSVVALLCGGVEEAARATGLRRVALTGGCLQNRILLEGLSARLSASGLEVLTHSAVPAGDGGLALGQALAGILAATA